MPTSFINCTASSLLQSRGLYRITWSQQITLGIATGSVQANLDAIYNGGMDSKGLGYPASQPAVSPADTAGTLDVRAPTLAKGTLGTYAGELEKLATIGLNLTVARVELVPPAEGAAAAALNRDRATNEVMRGLADRGILAEAKSAATRLVFILLAGLAVYAFVSGKAKGAGGSSW